MTNLAIEYRNIDQLTECGRHARRAGREVLGKMAAAIEEYGFRVPLLVTGQGEVVDGHLRLAAARRLKLGTVPVIVVDGMGAEQLRRFRLLINRSAAWAGWDEDILALELAELRDLGEDLTLTGFDVSEIDDLLAALTPGPEKDPEDFDQTVEPVPVEPGELWRLGQHLLLCGDAESPESYVDLLAGRRADAVWTDPPYNVNYQGRAGRIMNDHLGPEAFQTFLRRVFVNLYEVLTDGGPFYVAFADSETQAFRGGLTAAGFKIAACLIWVKDNIVLGRGDYQWRHEPILYGWKPTAGHPWYGGRARHTVFEAPGVVTQTDDGGAVLLAVGDEVLRLAGENITVEALPGTVLRVPKPLKSKLHPTTKPVELIERCLKNSTKLGDLVLDPFGGSGSTLIACERLGRRARLMELDPRYAGLIIRRWEEFTGAAAQRVEAPHA